MAVKTLDEMLASLSGEQKTLFEKTLTDNPELKAGWMRQDDYSRRQTELQSKKAEYDEAVAYKEKMEPWAEEVYPRIRRLEEAGVLDKDGNELWTSQKAELEQRIEQARAEAVGGEMDAAELNKRVSEIIKANGGATKEEISALVKSEGAKLAKETFDSEWAVKEKNFNEKTIPFVAGFSTAMAVAAGKYEKETGEAFTREDQEKVFAMMTSTNNFDPYKVMEEYAAPHRQKKQTDQEVEKRVREELAKRGMPEGGGESYIPQQQDGALKSMLKRSAGESTDFEAVIQERAVAASKELIAEGKV